MIKFKQYIKDNIILEGISSNTLKSYLETAIWSDGEDDVQDKDIRDFDKSFLNQAKKDLNSFFSKIKKIIKDKGYEDKQIAHDFWLTRNGRGAGFWDGDYDDVGDDLTKIANKFPEIDVYVGDDGKLYS